MIRSIVKHGPATLTVSLPIDWVRKNNVHPQSNVDIQEKGEQLIINAKKGEEFTTLKLDIKNNYKVGLRYINSAYRKGCDELVLFYDDSEAGYLKMIEKCLAEEVLGFEIVKHGKNEGKIFCVIRDIPGIKFDEFNTLLERSWFILLSMSEDLLTAFENKDKKLIEGFHSLDKRINKFTNFCIRVLTKKGHPKYKNIPLYYRFLMGIEELADHYKYLSFYYCENEVKPSKEFMNQLKQINETLKLFHKTFYKPCDESVEKILIETSSRNKLINKNLKNKADADLYPFLFEINNNIRSLAPGILELNIVN